MMRKRQRRLFLTKRYRARRRYRMRRRRLVRRMERKGVGGGEILSSMDRTSLVYYVSGEDTTRAFGGEGVRGGDGEATPTDEEDGEANPTDEEDGEANPPDEEEN
jgi:hypothetical protein